jgi:hypothetical protein
MNKYIRGGGAAAEGAGAEASSFGGAGAEASSFGGAGAEASSFGGAGAAFGAGAPPSKLEIVCYTLFIN